MNASANVRTSVRSTALAWVLPALVALGAILRLLFIGNEGFKNDISSFESWAMTLAQHPFSQFYDKAGFADYPPGYFYILWAVGALWETLFRHADPSFTILKCLVKLPAIVADLAIGVLLYHVVRRFASQAWALGAAALYLLNPAVIMISAVWGQVDAISGGLALLAVFLLLRASDASAAPARFIVGAWLALGYAILIKPQTEVLLVPLFVAFAFAEPALRRRRVVATVIGAVAALAMGLALAAPFHPTWNIANLATWLIGRYEHGATVYPFNSINAFNLWTISEPFWQPERVISLFGLMPWLTQWTLGIVLTLAATALIIWRYLQARTQQALIESAALLLLAFFLFFTRMHERYIFDGMLFTIAAIGFARRYLWMAIIFSLVLLANLTYSLQYLAALDLHLAVNTQDLWGPLDHVLSLVNVAAFFWLGYSFLGAENAAASVSGAAAAPSTRRSLFATLDRQDGSPSGVRGWFDPREGLVGMRWWIDYAVAAALGIASFVLSFVGYWYPTTKIFDEIYFALAGEEYLKHVAIYESTHPPLTKLMVTLSMLLFGGLHGAGDTSVGWRFLDVVFGALVVVLLYIFAKRIVGSTFFAVLAAAFLGLDGMHFVQSRIATPEGFVVFFSLAAVYAFYRFWIAEQVSVRAYEDERYRYGALGAAVAAAVIGTILSVGIVFFAYKQSVAATVVIAMYFALGLYLLFRQVVLPRIFKADEQEIAYPEGSHAVRRPDGSFTLTTSDGAQMDARGKTLRRGAITQGRGSGMRYEAEELEIVYARDTSVTYRTPVGDAVYTPGHVSVGGLTQRGADARIWLILFTVALGCLVSSKWYGVMGFGVSFVVLIYVWLQRYWTEGRRPALWGNPRGYRLDVALVTIAFISATVYGLVWTRDVMDHADIKNLSDVVYRQYSMFEYHDHLKATHPYSSKWWEWPIDWVPVAYYYEDHRANTSDGAACCVQEITSMPNPFILWFGLICVPFVGVLAWMRRNKGYALIVLTYLLQWLPWMESPRITFAYHFYVDVPLICLCNAISLQWLWNAARRRDQAAKLYAGVGIAAYTALVLGGFLFFYPILSAHPITWNAWHARMWFRTWIIGPG